MDDSTNPYSNPYSAPQVLDAQLISPYAERPMIEPASRGVRFANWVIDYIAHMIVGAGLGVVLGITMGAEAIEWFEGLSGWLIGTTVSLAYYIVLEGATGQTLGKLVTGTKVVNEQGGTPSFGQIVGRTFARLIPFEPFSFFNSNARGWHDSLPGTYVVKVR